MIDEFTDASGIDASASTNETLTGGYYVGQVGSQPTGGTISTSTMVVQNIEFIHSHQVVTS